MLLDKDVTHAKFTAVRCRWQKSLSRLESEMPEFRQNADDEIAEYLTISNEAGDEVRRIKPELAGLEEEVMP